MNTYRAKSSISINILLPSGSSKHIAFQPQTMGGSVYYTESADEISGLESHPKYNRLFVKVADAPKPAKKEVKKPEVKAKKEIAVGCEEDAKTILCDRYGCSRTKLKKVEQIKSAAAEHGIEFTGI